VSVNLEEKQIKTAVNKIDVENLIETEFNFKRNLVTQTDRTIEERFSTFDFNWLDVESVNYESFCVFVNFDG
jgi:hypothetical protein